MARRYRPISAVGLPVPVESEDGGGAVVAAIYVDDGANDGPAASVRVVHIATEGFRDVGRYEVQRKRAERASGTDVAGARPVPVPSP